MTKPPAPTPNDRRPRPWAVLVLSLSSLVLVAQTARRRAHPGCPSGSVSIDGRFCVDRYEASLEELLGRGRARPWDPFLIPDPAHTYRARSRSGVFPQAYVSAVQAERACHNAHKRLCTETEWVRACKGPSPTAWPYGPSQQPGRCNDQGINPVPRLFGHSAGVFNSRNMNDPRLNTMDHTLAHSGQHARCTNRFHVYDMVGNLHEWVSTRHGSHGVFRGGFFADVRVNGQGCDYATRAHGATYHDYSTGFRCCADL